MSSKTLMNNIELYFHPNLYNISIFNMHLAQNHLINLLECYSKNKSHHLYSLCFKS